MFAEITITFSLRNGGARKAVHVPAGLVNHPQLAQAVCPFPPEVSSFLPFSWPPGCCGRSFCFCVGLSSPLFLQLSQRGKLFPYMLIIRDLVPVFPFKNILPEVQLFFTALPHTMLCSIITRAAINSEYKNPPYLQIPHLTLSVL